MKALGFHGQTLVTSAKLHRTAFTTVCPQGQRFAVENTCPTANGDEGKRADSWAKGLPGLEGQCGAGAGGLLAGTRQLQELCRQ